MTNNTNNLIPPHALILIGVKNISFCLNTYQNWCKKYTVLSKIHQNNRLQTFEIWLFQKSVVSLYYKIKKTKNPKK